MKYNPTDSRGMSRDVLNVMAKLDTYGCHGRLTLLVRYLTGRLPPPSPHTLSSLAIPWFMPSIVDAFSRAALEETYTT